MLCGRVHVDDQFDVVNVDAAGGDVGSHEDAHFTAGELGEVAVTGVLRQVAVQVDGGDAGVREGLGKLAGVVLGPHEEDATACAGRQFHNELLLDCLVVDHQDVVFHGGDRGLGIVHGVRQRVGQITADELVNTVVQRRGEEQALTLLWSHVHELLDHGEEAEVGHVVGLIQDGDLNSFEGQDALADQVFEAARASDDNIDAGAQRLLLACLGDAAEDHGGVQAHGFGQRLDGGVDLGCELAGRCEDQAHGTAGLAEVPCLALCQAGNQRDGECDGLAGAGAATAQDIAACEGVRQGLDLDGECFFDAVCGEGFSNCLGRAKGSKSSHYFMSFGRCPVADIGPRRRLGQGFAEEKSGGLPVRCNSGGRDQMERVHRRRMCLSHEKCPVARSSKPAFRASPHIKLSHSSSVGAITAHPPALWGLLCVLSGVQRAQSGPHNGGRCYGWLASSASASGAWDSAERAATLGATRTPTTAINAVSAKTAANGFVVVNEAKTSPVVASAKAPPRESEMDMAALLNPWFPGVDSARVMTLSRG